MRAIKLLTIFVISITLCQCQVAVKKRKFVEIPFDDDRPSEEAVRNAFVSVPERTTVRNHQTVTSRRHRFGFAEQENFEQQQRVQQQQEQQQIIQQRQEQQQLQLQLQQQQLQQQQKQQRQRQQQQQQQEHQQQQQLLQQQHQNQERVFFGTIQPTTLRPQIVATTSAPQEFFRNPAFRTRFQENGNDLNQQQGFQTASLDQAVTSIHGTAQVASPMTETFGTFTFQRPTTSAPKIRGQSRFTHVQPTNQAAAPSFHTILNSPTEISEPKPHRQFIKVEDAAQPINVRSKQEEDISGISSFLANVRPAIRAPVQTQQPLHHVPTPQPQPLHHIAAQQQPLHHVPIPQVQQHVPASQHFLQNQVVNQVPSFPEQPDFLISQQSLSGFNDQRQQQRIRGSTSRRPSLISGQNDETLEREFREQAQNAKYSFASHIDDSISGQQHQREEVRDGLAVKGMYSYNDGYVKRTVHYEADDKGYRVVREEEEPLGDGPKINPNGQANVASYISGNAVQYSITAADIQQQQQQQQQQIEQNAVFQGKRLRF